MNTYLGRLTFFRFVAALIVVYFHVGQKVPPATFGILQTVVASGSLAVSFFFCLSGFVLTTVYDHDKFNPVSFWIARFSRIYPVYLLCMVLGALLTAFPAIALVLDVFLLQSWIPGYPSFVNPPAWSLSVEALFYAAFPLLMRYFHGRSRNRVVTLAAALWIATQMASSYLFKYHFHGFQTPSSDAIFYFPLMHINEFVIGALGAVLYKDFHESRYAAPISLVAVATSVLATYGIIRVGSALGWVSLLENGMLAPVFVSSMWLVASLPRAVGNMLADKRLVLLGEASYSLYLLQVPLAYLLPKYTPGIYGVRPVLYFYIYLAVLILASLVTFVFFEKPLRTHLKVVLGRLAGTIRVSKATMHS
jgi:peptidoglycan/LPS O-acetylase OafA/YrhL